MYDSVRVTWELKFGLVEGCYGTMTSNQRDPSKAGILFGSFVLEIFTFRLISISLSMFFGTKISKIGN